MTLRLSLLSVLSIASLVMLGANQAQATLLAYDPFDYATGSLNGKGPGPVGFTGTWNGGLSSYVVQSGNLAYPPGTNLPMTGNQARVTGGAGTIRQTLSTPIDFSSAGTYYVSFQVRKNADLGDASEFFFLTMNNTGDSSSKIAMGMGSTEAMLLGTTTGSFNLTATNYYSANETYLYLTKIVTHSGATPDQYFSKMISASSGSVPLTEPVWDLTSSNVVNGTAGRIEFNIGSASDYTVDAFRLSTTYFDATQIFIPAPEPSSVLLLGMGSLGLVVVRRRNRRLQAVQ